MADNRNRGSNNRRGRGRGLTPVMQTYSAPVPKGVDWDTALFPTKRLIDAFKKDIKSLSFVLKDGEVSIKIETQDGKQLSVGEYRNHRSQKAVQNAFALRVDSFMRRLARPELKDVKQSLEKGLNEAKDEADLQAALSGLPDDKLKIIQMDNRRYQSIGSDRKSAKSGSAESSSASKEVENQ